MAGFDASMTVRMPGEGSPSEAGSGPATYGPQRIAAALLALPLSAFALMVAREQLRSGFDPMGAIFGAGAATGAILGWWFALCGHIAESRVRMRITLRGGLILGGISFAAGFLGPIILAPGANQGPLLGIFFTGPLGFILGCVMGWVYARILTREPKVG